MDLYHWLICAKQNGHEDRVIALINEDTKIAYKIITNDLYSRDWTYMVPTVPNKPVYYQISYLLRDVDKKLLGDYYVTEVIIEKNPAPFINGICYHVMVKEMAPANQLKMEGDNGDMVTLYDWLKCKIFNGKGDREVVLISVLSTNINDTKEKERCTIDSLFFNNRVDFLSDYYITRERLLVDSVCYYELTVTDKLCIQRKKNMSMPNSHYCIDPLPPLAFSKEQRTFKELLNATWGTKKHLEIKETIVNGPATIIFWSDGTKTVVKCDEDDVPDYEKGILYAALKKLSTKKEYDIILREIDSWREYNNVYPELFPDNVEVEKSKKAKKVYKRQFGDSNKQCPYCGQNWIWTQERRKSLREDGFVNITCRNCGGRFKYIIGGGYES